ncbi:GD20001 [Drosophila simulans]|uniref:GD20001 n=1 Tax=Drosophila simulans TaxID=7240 RepID=B4R135_DROSI|nr:GD20001 [Drosophila simulans]
MDERWMMEPHQEQDLKLEYGMRDAGCRMLAAGFWMLDVGRGSYCWTDCHGSILFW